MSDSFTTNLGLTKPEVGASNNTWGSKTNADWDIVDGIFTSASTTPVAIVLRDDMKFVNATTTSQQVLLSCAGISTGTQRTLTAPDASGTIALQSVLRGYIGGLTLSNDAVTPNSKLDVSTGVAMDDTNTTMLSLASGVINCGTTGANGLDTGSLAISTWYHTFAIGTPGAATTALLASTSLSPSMPATYTLKRRIGSFLTDGSAHIIPFVQSGDMFLWSTARLDFNSTGGSGAVTLASVPTGVNVIAIFNFYGAVNSGEFRSANFYSLVAGNPTINASIGNADIQTAAQFQILTNTSGQIGNTVDAGWPTFELNTVGWIDRRGRDA